MALLDVVVTYVLVSHLTLRFPALLYLLQNGKKAIKSFGVFTTKLIYTTQIMTLDTQANKV
jgi:hypothetical protein